MRPLWLLLLLLPAVPAAAVPRPADRAVVCKEGVLRWADTGDEVALFGVNYYPPFSINYRDLQQIGADHEQVMAQDIAHFVRLGLDLVRLHVWDREISDRAGNLVENEHLRLLDALIHKCKQQGIYLVLTPIAWWGAPGPSDGFSNAYTIHQMTADPAARKAQQTYLEQFLRHRNRYTGLSYAEEPAIAAIELINEPLYANGTTDEQVTAYIEALADGVRASGCRKPVFYNGWAGRLAAVGRSSIEGCTFGWYPTGLVAGHALAANFLPRVQDYAEMRSPALAGKAIGVYEFDAADVAEGYLYPAMARSFRAGGAQFAAQFQYDPLPLAPFNAGWQTHYLNLIYTPQKALSFLIASEAFHALPRRQPYGAYPQSNRFGEFRVSYEESLSERAGPTAFLYSNDTRTRPPAPERLERIAGCGSSPVVSYGGTGAYFLDRLAPGWWRLEVYPDAVWTTDPFAATHVGREVARVLWREWPMRLSLPDLGKDFTARPTAGGKERAAAAGGKERAAAAGEFAVRPGVYLLRARGARGKAPALPDTPFVAPPERTELPPAVRCDPPAAWVSGRDLPVRVTVAAASPEVALRYRGIGAEPAPGTASAGTDAGGASRPMGRPEAGAGPPVAQAAGAGTGDAPRPAKDAQPPGAQPVGAGAAGAVRPAGQPAKGAKRPAGQPASTAWKSLPLRREGAYRYAGTLPGDALRAGKVECRVTVGGGRQALSFPGGIPPAQAEETPETPAVLFAAGADTAVPEMKVGGAPGQTARAELAALPAGRYAVRLTATGFGEPPSSAGIRLAATAPAHPERYDMLVVRARALEAATGAVELGLEQSDGQCFGYDVPLATAWRDVRIPLAGLKPLWSTRAAAPDLAKMARVSLIFGAWLYGGARTRPHGLEVERISLEKSSRAWSVAVYDAAAPIPVLLGDDRVSTQGSVTAGQSTIGGREGPALRLGVGRFGAGGYTGFRVDLSDRLQPWRDVLAGRSALHLRVRAGEPATTAVEVVLVEQDGAPWGLNVPLTREWQDVRIPWKELGFFTHWKTPQGRGDAGDGLRPEHLQALNVCFGAWLFPERAGDPHAVEIEGIWVE